MKTAVPAPVSSDEGGDATEEMEKEEHGSSERISSHELVEEQGQEDAGDVPDMETAPASSAKEDGYTEEIEEEAMDPQNEELVEEQIQEDEGHVVETAVPAPVSSDEGSGGSEEMQEAVVSDAETVAAALVSSDEGARDAAELEATNGYSGRGAK